MEKINIDEVILKKELNIPLTEQEIIFYNNIDEDAKNVLAELLKNPAYQEETIELLNTIIEKNIAANHGKYNKVTEKCLSKRKELTLSANLNKK